MLLVVLLLLLLLLLLRRLLVLLLVLRGLLLLLLLILLGRLLLLGGRGLLLLVVLGCLGLGLPLCSARGATATHRVGGAGAVSIPLWWGALVRRGGGLRWWLGHREALTLGSGSSRLWGSGSGFSQCLIDAPFCLPTACLL